MFPSFYQQDYLGEGFKWLIVDDNQQSIFAYQRKDKDGNVMLHVMNFTPNVHHGLRIPVEVPGIYKELLNTDRDIYGGTNLVNTALLHSEEVPWTREENSIVIELGAFSSAIIKLEKKFPPKKVEKPKAEKVEKTVKKVEKTKVSVKK